MAKPRFLCSHCGKRVQVRRGAFGEPYPFHHDTPDGGLCHGNSYMAVSVAETAASGMEAATAGETGTGSTEGDSPTAESGDAQ